MKQRQAQKQQTRTHLLHIAVEQFSKQGILSTTTATIAKAAQVSHGNLFAHFSTREALLVAVIEELGLKMGIRFQELIGQRKGLRELLSAHLSILAESEALYAQLVITAPILHEEARHSMFNIQSGISHHMSRAIQEELGTVNMPHYLIFNTWLGLVHHYLVNRDLFAPGRSVLAEKGEELINFFMQLIKGEKNGNM